MAEGISIRRSEHFSSVMSFLGERFCFEFLKMCVIAMRDYKKPTSTAAKINTIDLYLKTIASSC